MPIRVLTLATSVLRWLLWKPQMLDSIGVVLSLHSLEEILAFDALTIDCGHDCYSASLRGGCSWLHLQVPLRGRRWRICIDSVLKHLVCLTNESVKPSINALDRGPEIILLTIILPVVTINNLSLLLRRYTGLQLTWRFLALLMSVNESSHPLILLINSQNCPIKRTFLWRWQLSKWPKRKRVAVVLYVCIVRLIGWVVCYCQLWSLELILMHNLPELVE